MKLTGNSLYLLVFVAVFCVLPPFAMAQKNLVETNAEYKKCWSYSEGGQGFQAGSADQGVVFVASENGRITAIDAASGEKIWTSDIGGSIVSNIAASNGHVFVVTRPLTDDGKDTEGATLRILSQKTGVIQTRSRLAGKGDFWLGAINEVVTAAAASGEAYGLQQTDGSVKWNFSFAEGLSARPLLSEGKVMFGTRDKRLLTVAASTGEAVSTISISEPATAIGKLSGTDIAYGDGRGMIMSVTATGSKPTWKFRTGGQVMVFSVIGGEMLAASFDNFVYSLDPSSGRVRWKKRMPARIRSVVPTSHNTAVVITADQPNAVVLNRSDGRIVSQIPMSDPSLDLVTAKSDILVAIGDESVSGYSISVCKN